MSSKARRIIQRLFAIFMAEPQLLSPEHRASSKDKYEQARKIADYIAGMTDRYAMRQYRKLYEIEEV